MTERDPAEAATELIESQYELRLNINPWGDIRAEEIMLGVTPFVGVNLINGEGDLQDVLEVSAYGIPFQTEQDALDVAAEVLQLGLEALKALGANTDHFVEGSIFDKEVRFE